MKPASIHTTPRGRVGGMSVQAGAAGLTPSRPASTEAGVRAAIALCITLFVWLLVTSAACAGQTAMGLGFEEANKLYAEGKFPEAADAYQKLASSGRVSASVLYNEGNAWFKAGKLGRAIAAYHRALALDPRDPDTLANLQFARERVTAPSRPPGRLARAFARLTVNEWTALACVAGWLCFGLLAAGEFTAAGRPRLRRYAIWAGSLAVVLLICLGFALRYASAPRVVVLRQDAAVRTGPFDEAPSAFTVNDGAEFPVLDTKDAWLQIAEGPNRTGWIKAEAVARLGR
jgi:tetratricopeptide (TPR) repeat protein